jgi:chromosome partitioning protein
LPTVAKSPDHQFPLGGGRHTRASAVRICPEGLSQLLKTVERVKTTLNPKLTIQGVVLRCLIGETAFRPSGTGRSQCAWRQGLPDSHTAQCRVSEALSMGNQSYLRQCLPGSQAYIKLASEVIRRERELRAA